MSAPALSPCTRCNGSGTEPRQPSADEIRAYMRATGWEPKDAGGSLGTIWKHPDHEQGVGVFHETETGSREWSGLIGRLADREGRSRDAVISAVNAMERL